MTCLIKSFSRRLRIRRTLAYFVKKMHFHIQSHSQRSFPTQIPLQDRGEATGQSIWNEQKFTRPKFPACVCLTSPWENEMRFTLPKKRNVSRCIASAATTMCKTRTLRTGISPCLYILLPVIHKLPFEDLNFQKWNLSQDLYFCLPLNSALKVSVSSFLTKLSACPCRRPD